MIETIRQGLHAEGITVSMAKLCRWLDVPRRTVYYRPVRSAPKVDRKYAEPIKALIEHSPSFGYRTVAHLLGFNKNTVQRVFQPMGWQVRKRPVGFRPRIQALPSVAATPNERWSTDLCRIWAGRLGHLGSGDRWSYAGVAGLAPVAPRQGQYGRQCAGACADHSIRRVKPCPGAFPAAFGQRLGGLPRASTRRWYEAMDCVRSSSPRTAPNRTGWSNGLFARSKSSCVHRHRFESLQHARRTIGDWAHCYNHRRPHQALDMKPPAQAYAVAA